MGIHYIGNDNFLDKALARVEVIEHDNPQLITLHDVFVLPEYEALYRTDGTRIDESKVVNLPKDLSNAQAISPSTVARVEASDLKREPPTVSLPAQYETVTEPVLFLGSIWPHYGHYLTDSMARLWGLDFVDADRPVLLLDKHVGGIFKIPYVSDILHANKIHERTIYTSSKGPLLLREVTIPSASIQHSHRIYHCHQAGHLKLTESQMKKEAAGKRIYLSRSGLTGDLRRSEGEFELQSILQNNGFEIVFPERLSLEDQIDIFNNADWIVGTMGSAFHTSLFSRTDFGGNIAILNWGGVNLRYLMIDAIKGYNSFYLECMRIDAVKSNSRISTTTIDVERSIQMLKSIAAI